MVICNISTIVKMHGILLENEYYKLTHCLDMAILIERVEEGFYKLGATRLNISTLSLLGKAQALPFV